MVRDPEAEKRAEAFLAGRPRTYSAPADVATLQTQLNGVADMLVVVVKERDKLIKVAVAAESAKIWTRILMACVGVLTALVGFLAVELFARL